jgi:rod shape-determining protein MreD
MSDPIKYLLRFLLFLFVQALVLSNVPPLHRFISPYLYFLFLIWLPFSTGRVALLFTGFLLGLFLDFFTKTPGLHASSALLVAYLRPFLINLMVPKDTRELAVGSPSIQSMGTASYILFISLLTFFHHGWLVFLEWMTFGDFVYFLGKVFFTTLVSLIMILITELIFRPATKSKRR